MKQKPFFQGVNFGFYARNGYFSSPEAAAEVEKMKQLNIKWVCLITTIMQEAFYSTRQFRDFVQTPGDDELIDIIGLLHKSGIQVMLRPMIECWDGTQRLNLCLPQGNIMPGRPFHYLDDWFKNYAGVTNHYLRIANRTGCEAYGLDSELNPVGLATDHWLKIIESARKTYKGHLTTSMVSVPTFTNHLKANPNHWFYALDSVGSSMYGPASADGSGTVETMTEYLRKTQLPAHREFAAVYGKNFYFGECGCCSTKGAAKLPYYWANGNGYGGTDQANYMAAVLNTFSSEDWWGGMLWWKWDEQNYRAEFHEDPAGDKGFTIDGKPAAQIMKKWCSGE